MPGTRDSYDLVAARYADGIGDELRHKPLDCAMLDALVSSVGDGLIADVGGGPGHIAAYLAAREARVVASDLSVEMCRAASVPVCAADMTALPYRSSSLGGIVCFYAVIHLSDDQRAVAYAEFARVLRPGGQALIAFHVSDDEIAPGGAKHLTEWLGADVNLTFRYLDPAEETSAL